MDNFYYNNSTKVFFGNNMVLKLGHELETAHIKKVLITYGEGSIVRNGIFDDVVKILESVNIEYMLFGGIKPNPDVTLVNEAIDTARKINPDAILAIGGGSVIDASKAIALGYYYEGDIWEVFVSKKNVNKALPLYTVLTRSATSSEMNPNTVISNYKLKEKRSFAAGKLTSPVASIIDPGYQKSLSREQTILGVIDSITHIIEYYFNGVKNVDIQDRISESLIQTLIKHTGILINSPKDYESRAQIAWCSTLAFNGLNSCGRFGGDFSTHSIEHVLSAIYPNIAHAEGLAVLLPHWMKFVYKEDIYKFSMLAEKVLLLYDDDKDVQALNGIDYLSKLFKSWGAPTSLKNLGVIYSDLENIAKKVTENGNIGRLKPLDKKSVLEILYKAYN